MIEVLVAHLDRETGKKVPVALVEFDGDNIDAAMNYAYRWTNNIDGSWSQGEEFSMDGRLYDNPDFNPNVHVLAPLPNHLGRTYGIRSTSVGDFMVTKDGAYTVASFGFEKVN